MTYPIKDQLAAELFADHALATINKNVRRWPCNLAGVQFHHRIKDLSWEMAGHHKDVLGTDNALGAFAGGWFYASPHYGEEETGAPIQHNEYTIIVRMSKPSGEFEAKADRGSAIGAIIGTVAKAKMTPTGRAIMGIDLPGAEAPSETSMLTLIKVVSLAGVLGALLGLCS